ncbi:MAG: hypothetical protein IT238_11900 [Bacteroidia bacterium]|nr:hypothetical protein [Bacteroidia bacterium]MCZ2249620.1 hypothetical protein [Bacteroidia bacterium]
MKNFNFKKFLPHILSILAFAIITLAYFSPMLNGKTIKQNDVMNFKGMSKEIVDYRNEYKKEPLWTNSMFSGMPAYQISVMYPSNWVRPLISVTSIGIPHPAAIIFLCMLGFYLLLINFKVDKLLAAFGAIAFAFSSYFIIIIEAGHNPKGYAIAYMAPVLLGILLAYRGKMWLGSIIAAISLSLELASNHVQITYYLAILCGIVVVGELVSAIQQKKIKDFIKPTGLLVVAAILAVLPNITNLLVTQEYTPFTIRGASELSDEQHNKTSGLDRDYATQWSYGIGETFTLMIPNYKGGQSQAIGDNKEALKNVAPEMQQFVGQSTDQYWGNQPFTSGPVYIGALICFLFVLGMLIIKDNLKWYLLAATILAIMLSWGKNFMGLTNFFMDYIPGYNKFRAVSMTLVIAELTIPIISIMAVRDIVLNPNILKEQRIKFYIALGVTAGLCLLFYLMPTMFQDFFKTGEYEDVKGQLERGKANQEQIRMFLDGMESARISIFKADAIRSFWIIILGAGLLFIYSLKQFNKNYLYLGLGIITLFDLWIVDKRYLNESNFVSKSLMDIPFEKSPADEQILKDPDPNYRVMNATRSVFQDASTSYFHKSIGGYHGAKLRRYQDLFDKQISQNNMQVLNMLNTKYFIMRDPKGGDAPIVQRNPDALGNAWFVNELKWVANPDSEINALSNFNPKHTAIVDKKWEGEVNASAFSFDSLATIKLKSYKADELVYESQAGKPQLAVFSEIYYPKGWNVYIDGKPGSYFSTDYVLRAMIVPAGKHEITYKFEPTTYYTGEKIAMAGSILLFLFIIGGAFLQYRTDSLRENATINPPKE